MSYGINIDIQPSEISTSNVIPMFRVIEAVPASIPDWAFFKMSFIILQATNNNRTLLS
ncbi:hypothetical protein ISG33_05305 [Glaciecola sp. MH2013]|uniref:hypothetical protein n=1 Tax=Glaciecola sp. MH2013 TaxID=2785524 RepID=UPI0018A04373|nr:hypothetical protein [Glaciecola sp. MH2013]MBF7072818.1 hypothetical protein [Glaciecola sp. MH2013]